MFTFDQEHIQRNNYNSNFIIRRYAQMQQPDNFAGMPITKKKGDRTTKTKYWTTIFPVYCFLI